MRFWLTIILLSFASTASAQFFNIGKFDSRPGETTFGNAGQPWPSLSAAINTENYDAASKPGIAYSVPNANTLPACQSTVYRADAFNLQASTDGPAFQIGCAVSGTFYQYIINVPSSPTCPCKVTPRLGSTSTGGSWALYIDNVLIGAVATPNTGSYTTMQGVDSGSFNLNPGNHTVRWQWASGDASGFAGSMSSFTFATISNLAPGFFVATNGLDTNAGTLAAPFRTVQACQTAMRNSGTNKTCYIRAGTYTAGSGYTTQNLAGGSQASLLLTSADNGTTYTEYPSDIPANAVSTAIFDGGATAWSRPTASASCPTASNPPYSALTDGIWIVGASNITIDHLMFQNYCWSAVMVQGAWTGGGSWSTDCEFINNGTVSDHVVISNNVAHDLSNWHSCPAGGLTGYRPAFAVRFSATNTTITHNLIYNVGGKAIDAVINPCSAGDGSQSNAGLSVDHNLMYNVVGPNDVSEDLGAVYMWDCNQNTSATKTISYNYVMSHGSQGGSIPSDTGFYDDDGTSAVTRFGNIVKSPGSTCFWVHSPRSSTDHDNICDLGNVSSLDSIGTYGGASGPCPSSAFPFPCGVPYVESLNRSLVIANTSSTAGCVNSSCPLFINWYLAGNTADPTYPGAGANNNNYYSYGAAGAAALQTEARAACCGGGSSDPNAQAIAPGFSCPGGNVDSWSYKLLATSPLFSAPTNFTAQPAGWGTPGFWGPQLSTWTPSNPQGYSVGTNHFGTAPSYIGSGVNGC